MLVCLPNSAFLPCVIPVSCAILRGHVFLLMPRPNALDISLDNARHFVESNVESVWPPCRVLLSLVERCRDKFEQVQNCRVVTLDISIVSSVVEGCRVRLARLSTSCSTFANQRMRNMQYFEHNLYPAFFSSEPLSSPFLPFLVSENNHN